MTVLVLFFGHWRDIAGASQTVILPNAATVEMLVGQLMQKDARLSQLLPTCRFAVNEEFAPLETVLAEGDVVAVLPPMSGG
jgi:molybdopterin converting factor subunit 1